LLFGFVGHTQTNTEAFLKKVPALPKDSCNITKSAAEAFSQKVSILMDEIENEISKLNEEVNDQAKLSESTAKKSTMQQMAQQYGLSPEEMSKMQNGKMSAADKKALADKMMQQQTNMSMGEVKNLGKMSEAGKKAYAEAYATEAMATSQSDPKQQQESAKAKNSLELLKEQQTVMARINATSQKIGNLYSAIENDPTRKQMMNNIEKWQSKLNSMMGVEAGQGDRMDSLSVLIRNEKINCCNKFTPLYRSALRQHFSIMKASFPDQKRLAEITSEITKSQTGISTPPQSAEIGNLESVKGYLNMLNDAYKFKLYYPEDN
jgi:hypothetical protein